MEVKTYRAKTLQEAVALVRRDLGPDAAVLHTRDVRTGGLWGWVLGTKTIEVTASTEIAVPSRLPLRSQSKAAGRPIDSGISLSDPGIGIARVSTAPATGVAPPEVDARLKFRDELRGQLTDLQTMVEDLCRRSTRSPVHDLPEALFHVFTDLIEADFDEELARELVERLRSEATATELADPALLKARVARSIEDEIKVAGPIRIATGGRRLVALVGPTGVGKTTTIAKLAANFRLREKRRVGLITVDTYRIAAVEQLRTYADIIDLPMEVVATPREMREAVARMSDLELILMDTAGRSPRDEVKIQELKSLLAEAGADEVHLVLSSVTSAASLSRTAERFAAVGTTALLLTKLDEATGLGNLLPLLRSSRLPLSYLTNGQNVPDDIRPADRRRLAMGMMNDEWEGNPAELRKL